MLASSEPPFRLLLITDRRRAPILASVRAALSRGGEGVGVLLRDKDLPAAERRVLGEALAPLCAEAGATLLVHGDAALAEALGAGLHLADGVCGAFSGLLGCSRHDGEGLARTDASYATLSPVLASPGKAPPLGWARFEALARSSPVPCFALGGLGPEHAMPARRAGAYGLAGIRGWLAAPDPAAAVRCTLEALTP